QVAVSYAATDREALAAAHEQWRNVALGPMALSDLPSPQAFDAAVADVRPEEVRRAMLVSSDPAKHARHLREFAALGPEAIYVHNVSRQQHAFIEAYRREVIPEFAPVAPLR
ncbi:MAG: LLM class F420-dependent oxidoreductase, partial [Dehalococcoidia bacterium]